MKKVSLVVALFIGLLCSNSASAQLTVGATLFDGGMKAYQEGRYSEAERLFRLVLVELEKVPKEDGSLLPGLMSDTFNALAGALHGQGKLSDAEKVLLQQIALLEKERIDSDKDFSQTSAALNNLGLLYAEQKKYSEAEAVHRKAIALREKYDPPPRRNLAISLVNLGKVYYDEGRYLEAETFFNQAQGIFLAIGGDNATDDDIDVMIMTSNNLALIAVKRGLYKEAEKRYLTVISITEAKKGKYHPDLIQYLNNYAQLLRLTKRLPAAKRLEARAAAIEKQN